jgi:YggT family protein
MIEIIAGIIWLIRTIIGLMIFILIANAILSWLVAFDVVNLRNRHAYSIASFLNALTRPILRPFQRFIPPFGGVDVSPVVAILLLIFLSDYVITGLGRMLIGALTPI